MTPAACPDARTLQALLEDDGEAAEWQPHLESCVHCQQALEGLAADAASWADAVRRLKRAGATPAPDGGPALVRVMERCKGDEAPGATEAEPAAEDELPPSFLRPADRPGLLGRLGDYEVLEVIGRGGMGVVFKAFDPALHRMTAIKVLAPHLAGSATARRRFLREGRAAAAVVHAHVITIYDVDEKDGLPYLVMQYVAGLSLQDKLDRDGPLPPLEILRIGMQTAAGLAAAHARGLIHRDIKPANILLENGVERVKITDFGLARAVDDDSCTRSGVVAGTPAYMAPEQARGEAPDPRADQFSLGSVLYAFCTGEPPFRADSSLATMRRVADDTPPRVRALNPEVPEWLEEIVSKLHEKNPAKRFGSAAEVAALLERHLAHLQQPAVMPKPGPLTPKPPRPTRRRWLCAAAAVLALAVAFGASEASGVTQVVQAVATALRISTSYGTLVVETDDPDVKVKVDGEEVVVTGAGVQEVRVKAGEHRVLAVKDGVPVRDELISISRGGKQVVKVSLESAASPAAPAALALIAAAPPPADAASIPPSGLVLKTARTVWTMAPGEGLSCGAISPDGKTLVSCRWDGSATIWDVGAGKERKRIPGVARLVRATAISPDNQTFATAADDNVVRVWDLDSGKPRAALFGHVAAIHALAYSPDGKTLASAAGDNNLHLAGELKLWDLATGKERMPIAPFDRPIWDMAYNSDGNSVAVALGDGSIQVVDAASGKSTAMFSHTDYARRIALSPDGKTLAVAFGDEGCVTLWDLEKRKRLNTFQAHEQGRRGPLLDLSFGPDGKRLLTCGVDGAVMIWTIDKTQAQDVLVRHAFTLSSTDGKVWFAVFSPDGRTVFTGGDDRMIHLWTVLESAAAPAAPAAPAPVAAAPPSSQPSGDIARPAPGVLLRTSATVWTWSGDSAESVCCGDMTPDGKTLIVGSWGGTVRIFDLNGGKLVKTIPGLSSGLRGLAVAPDGKSFATGAQDKLVRVWDLESGKPRQTLEGYSGRIMAVAFSPDGKALASAGGNFGKAGELKIWDLGTGKERAPFAPFAQDLWDVAWSPDGKSAAVACRDGSAQVVDAATGKVTATFLHSAYARRVAFTPDGKTLAVGYGDDGFVTFWDLETGKQRAAFQAQNGALFGLSFSADGKRLLTCGTAGTAEVWNVGKSVEPAFTLSGHQGSVCFAAFTPDGKTVATGGGGDKTVRLWDVGPRD